MKKSLWVLGAALLAGCFHGTVETGLQPSDQVITKDWASSWLFGLVPPSTIETQTECPRGVARVETKLTFLNQVVHFLTLGIYTPMSIRATCAQAAGTAAASGIARTWAGVGVAPWTALGQWPMPA